MLGMPVSHLWHVCHTWDHASVSTLLRECGVHSFVMVKHKECLIDFCLGMGFDFLRKTAKKKKKKN